VTYSPELDDEVPPRLIDTWRRAHLAHIVGREQWEAEAFGGWYIAPLPTRRCPTGHRTLYRQWLEAVVERWGPAAVARWENGPPAGWSYDEWRVRIKDA
jgi:hypothetical protein